MASLRTLCLLNALALFVLSFTAQAETVSRTSVEFQPLNPARGDASPKAGVLWGDIRENQSTGSIIEFVDGFSSPPHIHNVTYRGVVISGFVHNDDPNASEQWMGPGSFWIQPAGAPHITAASGASPITIFSRSLKARTWYDHLTKVSTTAKDPSMSMRAMSSGLMQRTPAGLNSPLTHQTRKSLSYGERRTTMQETGHS